MLPSAMDYYYETLKLSPKEIRKVADIYSHAIALLPQRYLGTATPPACLSWLYSVPDTRLHTGMSHYIRQPASNMSAEDMVLSLYFLSQLPIGRFVDSSNPMMTDDMVKLRAVLSYGSAADQCISLHSLGLAMATKAKLDNVQYKYWTNDPETLRRRTTADVLAWMILGSRGNINAACYEQMLRSFRASGGRHAYVAIDKMASRALREDLDAFEVTRNLNTTPHERDLAEGWAPVNEWGTLEMDFAAIFIEESQLAEAKAAERHAVSPDCYITPSVPAPSPVFGLPPSRPVPSIWAFDVSEHSPVSTPSSTDSTATYITAVDLDLEDILAESIQGHHERGESLTVLTSPTDTPLPLAPPLGTPTCGVPSPLPLELFSLNWSFPIAEELSSSPSSTTPTSLESSLCTTPVDSKESPTVDSEKAVSTRMRKRWSLGNLFRLKRVVITV